MKLDNLKRQHEEIRTSMEYILNTINQNNVIDSASDIAKELNKLAGKLKIHLISENDFLYPDLLKSSDDKLRRLGEAYIDEMKQIGDRFVRYKDDYNTKSKITSHVDEFIRETKETLHLLKMRLDKEDNELYPNLE